MAEVLRLPHVPCYQEQGAYERKEKNIRQHRPDAQVCPYFFEYALCTTMCVYAVLLQPGGGVKERAVGHVVRRLLFTEQKAPQGVLVIPFLVAVSLSVLWCHVCLLGYIIALIP